MAPKILASILKLTCNIEAFWGGWEDNIRNVLAKQTSDNGETFKRQLAEAIVHGTLSVKEYYDLTNDSRHNSPEELEEWLRHLWSILYGHYLEPEDYAEKS